MHKPHGAIYLQYNNASHKSSPKCYASHSVQRRQRHPTPVLLPGKSPRTEEPGGLPSMGSQSRTRLKRLSSSAHWVTLCYLHFLPALFNQWRQRPPYFDSILNSHYAYYLSALHLTQQNRPSDTEPAFPADRPCHNATVVSNSVQACELQPAWLLCPWDSPGKSTGVGCHALL